MIGTYLPGVRNQDMIGTYLPGVQNHDGRGSVVGEGCRMLQSLDQNHNKRDTQNEWMRKARAPVQGASARATHWAGGKWRELSSKPNLESCTL